MDRFDIISAYYLFFSNYHGGQDSVEYKRLSKITSYYKPSPFFSGYDDLSFEASEVYDNLVVKYQENRLKKEYGQQAELISLKEVFSDVKKIWEFELYHDNSDSDGNIYVAIRLRYFEENYKVLFGDSQYDTDHRGYWGYGEVNSESTIDDLAEVSYKLICKVLDSME